MAEQMQAIKHRMKSISNTERITNAMKLVAASKLKWATNRYTYFRQNLEQVAERLSIAITKEDTDSIYREQKDGKTLYIMITGSKGLCGGYNSAVTTEALLRAHADTNRCFLACGTKGRDFCFREKLELFPLNNEDSSVRKMLDIPVDDWSYENIQKIAGQILNSYRCGTIAKIMVIYTHYVNTMVQNVQVKQLFPVEEKNGEDIRKNRFCFAYEPEDPAFFDFLAAEYLALNLYGLLTEAILCEYSARRMAMKNASDNAKEMLKNLSVYYNQARQASITNEMIEIISGAETIRREK